MCRNTYRSGAFWDIISDYGIGADTCVRPYGDVADQLGACPDIDVTTQTRHATPCHPDGNLLEYQAVDSDLRIRMNHDSIRMRYQQPTTDPAVERNVRTGHGRPEAMTDDGVPRSYSAYDATLRSGLLIRTDAPKQCRAR
jgi:hypothetical protein